MDYYTFLVIMGGMLFVIFLMWWSYCIGKYFERYLQNLKTTENKKNGNR